jgi:hypothetical protein
LYQALASNLVSRKGRAQWPEYDQDKYCSFRAFTRKKQKATGSLAIPWLLASSCLRIPKPGFLKKPGLGIRKHDAGLKQKEPRAIAAPWLFLSSTQNEQIRGVL